MMDTEVLLMPEEAAEALRIGLNQCYKILNDHSLKAYRVGRSWRIPQSSIHDYIQNQLTKEIKKKNG